MNNLQNTIIEEESSQVLTRSDQEQNSVIIADTSEEAEEVDSGSENMTPSPTKQRKLNNFFHTNSLKNLRDHA